MLSDDDDKALESFLRLQKIERALYGDVSAEFAATLRDIGDCYNRKEMDKKALETYLECLALQKRVIGENHEDYATTLHSA